MTSRLREWIRDEECVVLFDESDDYCHAVVTAWEGEWLCTVELSRGGTVNFVTLTKRSIVAHIAHDLEVTRALTELWAQRDREREPFLQLTPDLLATIRTLIEGGFQTNLGFDDGGCCNGVRFVGVGEDWFEVYDASATSTGGGRVVYPLAHLAAIDVFPPVTRE